MLLSSPSLPAGKCLLASRAPARLSVFIDRDDNTTAANLDSNHWLFAMHAWTEAYFVGSRVTSETGLNSPCAMPGVIPHALSETIKEQ